MLYQVVRCNEGALYRESTVFWAVRYFGSRLCEYLSNTTGQFEAQSTPKFATGKLTLLDLG
jgi:hypothetical protein